MKINFINCFKNIVYMYVFIGFSIAVAGSYDDFFIAIKRDDGRAIQTLVSRGFDPNTPDPKGQYGLFLAVREPSLKVIDALIASPKTNVNVLNEKGESPLMLAALKGQQDVAQKLIRKGADVNKTGWTPLHYAATAGQVAIIRLLLEESAYIDAESPNGSTPLMMAAMYGSGESVKLLLEEGADPLLKNQQNMTALQFAQKASRPDAIEALAAAIRAKRPAGTW